MWRGQRKITQQLMSTMQWSPKMQRAARCCPRAGASNKIRADTGTCRCAAPCQTEPRWWWQETDLSFSWTYREQSCRMRELTAPAPAGSGLSHPPQCLHETVAEVHPGGSRGRHSDFPRLRWGSSAYSLWGSQEQLHAICERLKKGD